MLVVANGKSTWKIVTAPDADCVEQFAATELQKYIKEMTGTTLPVLRSSDIGSDPQPMFLLGKEACVSLAPQDSTLISEQELGSEGYTIQTVPPDRILLSGITSRGTLYSVYHFLELQGCRWFYPEIDPDDRVVPQTGSLNVERIFITTKPSFKYRMVYLHSILMEDRSLWLKQVDWAAKLRLNYVGVLEMISPNQLEAIFVNNGLAEEITRRGMKLNALGHSLHFFMPADKYFAGHPEWFCEHGGRRSTEGNFCLSNTEAVGVFVRNVVSFARSYPFIGIISLWAGDCARYCQCTNCSQHSPTDQYFSLITRVAEEFQKEGIDKPIEALVGYDATVELPKQTWKLPPNVILIGAQYNRKDSYAVANPWEEWRRRFPNEFCTFEYHADYNNNRSFTPLPEKIQEDVRSLKRMGASGVEICLYRGEDWRAQALNGYTLARMLWDADSDAIKIMLEHPAYLQGR